MYGLKPVPFTLLTDFLQVAQNGNPPLMLTPALEKWEPAALK
jgi:hypothetical protein